MVPDGPPNFPPPAATPPGVPPVRPAIETRPGSSGRGWWWLAVAAAIVVVLAGAVTAGIVIRTRHAPPRGDLVMTLVARTANGAPPSADALGKARDLLLARLTGAGYERPRVTVTGAGTLSVAVGAPSDADRPRTEDGLRMLAQPGRLSFRAVLASPTVRHTPPAPAPSTSAVPAAVVAKLGAAYPAAQAITDPDQVDPGTLAALAPFGALSPGEVATLPSGMQYAVPTITCAQLNGRPFGAVDDPAALVVACEHTGDQAKYLLDPAKVTAADVAGATVQLLAVPGWSVTIRFTPSGQARWTALTRDAVANSPSNQVAIVVDNLVISAPTIEDVITGDAEVSGAEIDRDAASRLGALLHSGPLPVVFVVSSIALHR